MSETKETTIQDNTGAEVVVVDGATTPPRPMDFAELGTPISGTTAMMENESTTNGSQTNLKLPASLNMPVSSSQQQQRRSRAEMSMTSSVYSVASGLVQTQSAVSEDLEGLVVQLDDEEESAAANKKHHHKASSMHAHMQDLKRHLDKTMAELRDQSRRDFEKVLSVLQAESAKRTALEGRLHSQLLMQSEAMVAMELKLLRLEAKVERKEAAQRQSRRGTPSFRTIDEEYARNQQQQQQRLPPPSRGNATIDVLSSGISLASGVTAEFGEEHSDDEGDVEDEGGTTDNNNDHSLGDSDSTPTQSSRHPPFAGTTLESILLNPMLGEVAENRGTSTAATRGDADGNSSLATSVTNSTLASTVVTAATGSAPRVGRSIIAIEEQEPRSRSQSPLTVQSGSVAAAAPAGAGQVEPHPAPNSSSVGSSVAMNSILSTAAVAPARSFGSRRAHAAATSLNMNGDLRPIANRVVSFENNAAALEQASAGDRDSITMPDELDNLSEVADIFSSSARLWREEYEARLDNLQKQWSE